MDRRLPIVIAVVGLHVLGLWALQAGLLRRAVELVVPVSVLSEMIEPPQPQTTPTPPQPQLSTAPTPKAAPLPRPVAQPAQQPVVVATSTLAPQPPTGVTEPQPPTPPVTAVASAEPTAPAAPAAAPKEEPQYSHATPVKRPDPPYPTLSGRLGETGVVELRVHVEVDGTPSEVQILKSSGYDRLDQAAAKTVKDRWRFLPEKKNGVPTASWVIQPVRFQLKK